MYIEFWLPSGAGGLAAQMAAYEIRGSVKERVDIVLNELSKYL